MTGDFERLQRQQQCFFESQNIYPVSSGRAIDLGCGHGLQSVSLARLGFSVTAVDFNECLLTELQQQKGSLNIKVKQEEILHFLHQDDTSAELIVCMGDTITHLSSIHDVEFLIKRCSEKLEAKGKIILSFRDLTNELNEEHRFIPVKGDAERIHTCFLEYFPDHVKVYDILHERTNGAWTQQISWYPKLRLNETMVRGLLDENYFQISHTEVINGMTHIAGHLVNV
jgi:SAM-dependent methyltransferase